MLKKYSIFNPSGTLCVEFMPQLGGSITAFFNQEGDKRIDLMRPAPQSGDFTVLDVSSFPLTPFSNRIGNGRFSFEGKEYEVGPKFRDEPHPNHGDGWTSAWDLKMHSRHRAILGLNSGPRDETPYHYRALQSFTLSGDTLAIDMMIENCGDKTLPFGTGHHPYFPRTSDVTLRANLPKIWNSRMMLPTELVNTPHAWDFSKKIPLSEEQLGPPRSGFDGSAYMDHCFAGWDGLAEIAWPEQGAKLTINADPVFSHFVIYIPRGDFFCAEPVSHATDAFNLFAAGHRDVGLTPVAPGQILAGKMSFTFDRI